MSEHPLQNPVNAPFDSAAKGPVENPELVILIVDDDPVAMTIVSAILKNVAIQKGFRPRIIESWDGSDGLSAFKGSDFNIHVVVSDRDMPEMDGLSMVRAIREVQGKEQPFIIMHSGRPAGEDPSIHEALAIKAGANVVVDKNNPHKANEFDLILGGWAQSQGIQLPHPEP